jgi:hypothetical protein
LIIQVTIAYKSKVEQLRNQGLKEEELDEKLELLKVNNRQNILSSLFFRKKPSRGKAILTNLKN